MLILIVEDEHKIAAFIKKGLEIEHYSTEVVHDGNEALEKIEVNDYDLIILDVMLPGIDGFEVAKRVRKNKVMTPILMLTARDGVEDRVKGLDAGADDYLIKPFSFEELLARIRSLLRREKTIQRELLEIADLVLDPATHEVRRGNREIELTSKEYRLLDYMMRQEGRVCTRTMITEHIWGYDFPSKSNIIDVYISRLRNKIDKDGEKKLFYTVRDVGYKLKS